MPKTKRVKGWVGPKAVHPTPARQAPLLTEAGAAPAVFEPRLLWDEETEARAQLLQPDVRRCRRCSQAKGYQVVHASSAFRQAMRKDGSIYYRPDCRESSWKHDAEKAAGDLRREGLDRLQEVAQVAGSQVAGSYGLDVEISLQQQRAS